MAYPPESPDVPTWTELLDDYEATIQGVEQAATSGEPPLAVTWRPPAYPPAGPPTDADLARFRRLRERDATSGAQVRRALAAAAAVVGDLERTGAAARAYGRVDRLIALEPENR